MVDLEKVQINYMDPKNKTFPAYLEDSYSVGMGQTLNENAPPAPSEVGLLDAVTESFGPVQPVVISGDTVGPADTF